MHRPAVSLVILLLLFSVSTSFAATRYEVVNIGDIKITLEYDDASFTAGEENILTAAIEATENRYRAIWGVTMTEYYVGVTPERGPDDLLARAGWTERRVPAVDGTRDAPRMVCFIEIFDDPAGRNRSELAFSVAHEIAHCYQGRYVRGYNTAISGQDWWTEGGAEWLATTVYPLPPRARARWRTAYADKRSLDLLNTGNPYKYDSVFFWAFLENALGTTGAVRFMETMPADAAAARTYVAGYPDAAALFSRYGRDIAMGTVPNQPAPSRMFSPESINVTSLPKTQQVFTDQFAFSIIPVSFALGGDPQRAVRISVENLGAYKLAIVDPYAEIEEGVEYTWCVKHPMRLVLSRAGGGGDLDQARVVIRDHSTPCSDAEPTPTPEPADTGNVPACLLGEWILDSWPVPGMDIDEFNPGASGMTIRADGSVRLAFDGLNIKMTGPDDVPISFTITGMIMEARSTFSGAGPEYTMTATSGQLAGTPTMMMDVGGNVFDNSASLRDIGRQIGVGSAIPVKLRCVDEDLMIYSVSAGGVTIDYGFRR